MYRNVLFRAIIDNMQWGGAGRGSLETAAAAQRDRCGRGLAPPTPNPWANESLEEGPQMLTLLFKDLSE